MVGGPKSRCYCGSDTTGTRWHRHHDPICDLRAIQAGLVGHRWRGRGFSTERVKLRKRAHLGEEVIQVSLLLREQGFDILGFYPPRATCCLIRGPLAARIGTHRTRARDSKCNNQISGRGFSENLARGCVTSKKLRLRHTSRRTTPRHISTLRPTHHDALYNAEAMLRRARQKMARGRRARSHPRSSQRRGRRAHSQIVGRSYRSRTDTGSKYFDVQGGGGDGT